MILHSVLYKEGILWINEESKSKINDIVDDYGGYDKLIINLLDLELLKIVAQSPNLSLPDIPYIDIENNIDHLLELETLMEDLPADWLGTGGIGSNPDKKAKEWRKQWNKAYKAASAKKYTGEDLRKALQVLSDSSYIQESSEHYTMDSVRFNKTIDEIIQSLQPKPVSVEIEMYNGNTNEPCEYWKGGKTFLKVKKINYE